MSGNAELSAQVDALTAELSASKATFAKLAQRLGVSGAELSAAGLATSVTVRPRLVATGGKTVTVHSVTGEPSADEIRAEVIRQFGRNTIADALNYGYASVEWDIVPTADETPSV